MQHFAPKLILKTKVILPTSTNEIGVQPAKKLLDRLRDAIRVNHYSYQAMYNGFCAFKVRSMRLRRRTSS
jgi:hypothetical protein